MTPNPLALVVSLFVVVRASGRYEDCVETLIRAFATKADADVFRDSQTLMVQRLAGMTQAVNRIVEAWEVANPYPTLHSEGNEYMAWDLARNAERDRLEALTGCDIERKALDLKGYEAPDEVYYSVAEVPFGREDWRGKLPSVLATCERTW
jgi:hypothetical protein